MLKLPTHLAKVAMLGAAPLGGGFASRAVSYAAGSQIRDAAKGHLPTWAGGQSPRTDADRQAESRTATGSATPRRSPVPQPPVGREPVRRSTGGGAGTVSAGAGGTRRHRGPVRRPPANGRGYTPPPTAQANASGQPLQNGLQTPSFAGREHDFANETFEAQFRERTNPVSAEQAMAALASLPETPSAVSGSSSQTTAPARASISPTRRWGNGRPRSAKRCARSPPPAPTSARKPSTTSGPPPDGRRWRSGRRDPSRCGAQGPGVRHRGQFAVPGFAAPGGNHGTAAT